MNPLLAAGAASYGALGLVSFLQPDVVPAVIGADARTEVRAVYGGLPLAFAATLALSPASGTAIGAATAGMAAGRAGSALLEGRLSPRTAVLVVLESAVAAALVAGARAARR